MGPPLAGLLRRARCLPALALTLVGLCFAATPAAAHPHIFVEAREEMLFDAQGRITAVRHVWRFDDAFSAFATRGLDKNHDGKLSTEELAPLAAVNMKSLKIYDYFTFFYRDQEKLLMAPPVQDWLTYDGGQLTLFFTVPLHAPIDASVRPVRLDVFDPEFYVDFTLTDDTPFALKPEPAGTGHAAGIVPATCTFTVKKPDALDSSTAATLSAVPADIHDLPPELRAITAALANTMVVTCPSKDVVATAVPPGPAQPTPTPPDAGSAQPDTTPARVATPNAGASPLGVGLNEGGGSPTGIFAIANQWQQAFYSRMTATIRDMKTNGWAGVVLILLSLGYGVFHAVGPGHGKTVISAYLLSSRGTARRALLLSVLSSLLQATVAVGVVTIVAVVLDLTTMELTAASEWMETASYAFVVLLGLTLVWRKILRPFIVAPFLPMLTRAWAAEAGPRLAPARSAFRAEAAGIANPRGFAFSAAMPAAASAPSSFGRVEAKSERWSFHGPACDCGAHLVMPEDAAGGWRGMVGAVLSAGLRPCTGALIVLVFALSQGLYPIGIVSAYAMAVGTACTVLAIALLAIGAREAASRLADRDARLGRIAHRSLEALGAVLVLATGILLFGGAMTAQFG